MVKISKKLLNESSDLNVYIDDLTGDEYVYDGSKLVLIKVGNKNIGDKGSGDYDYSEEEAKRNAEAAENGTLETADELESRLKEIEDNLNDTEKGKRIDRESRDKKAEREMEKEAEKARRELARFRNDPIVKLKMDITKLLNREIETLTKKTWSRPNRHRDDREEISAGKQRYEKFKKPVVQVYFDRSGSWQEPKLKAGREVVHSIEHQFVRKGLVELRVSYFSDVVFSNYDDPHADGGTYGTPILADIQARHPDNVLIMTDADIDDCRINVEVPGAVWFLWKGGISQNLMSHLSGKLETKSYEM